MDTSKIIIGTVGGGRYTVTAPIVKEDYVCLWASNFQSSLFMTTMPSEVCGLTVKDNTLRSGCERRC